MQILPRIDRKIQTLLNQANCSLDKLRSCQFASHDLERILLRLLQKEHSIKKWLAEIKIPFLHCRETFEDRIANYLRALDYGMRELEKSPLTLELLKKTHELLFFNENTNRVSPGRFRDKEQQLIIPLRVVKKFASPPPEKIPFLMNKLFSFQWDRKLPPLINAILLYRMMIQIHPFSDGNGRSAELLFAFYLHKKGIQNASLLYMRYYTRLFFRYQPSLFLGAQEEDLTFFLKGISWTVDLILLFQGRSEPLRGG